ncbi:hypothetical protein QJS10_CPB11g02135 [Acorus calamus]|uniref:Phosphoglycerate mutase n=1 Tax=Acorus calamus TaxID=4465 RepID=A0AAV9DTX8_ACOCL|nr:hypothetical protein QJS10_CPB11g02135 [Acorus calamus]
MAGSALFRNRYWVLRHGKSIPNERGIIVNGTLEEYALAPEGIDQARLAGELLCSELKENNIPIEDVQIYYSPFSRTTNTAKTVASVLNVPFEIPQCKAMEELRERFFGPELELQSHDKYPEIWALDEKDPFLGPEGGESVSDVSSRLAAALEIMEAECQGCAVVIVSHGDPLQILQTVVHAAKQHSGSGGESLSVRIEQVRVSSTLSQHRKFALLTGELRKIA